MMICFSKNIYYGLFSRIKNRNQTTEKGPQLYSEKILFITYSKYISWTLPNKLT